MNADRTRMLPENIIRYPIVRFPIARLYKAAKSACLSGGTESLAEIRGKDDLLYALDATQYFACFNLAIPRRENQVEVKVTLDRVAPYQNSSLSPNWICREGVAVAVMTPPNGLYSAPWKTTSYGYDKFG